MHAGQLVKVWIDGPQKSCVRRAVVTHVTATAIEVVYGQSARWVGCAAPAQVTKDSLLGKRLKQRFDTYYCDAQVVPLTNVRHVFVDVCPASDYGRIEAVAADSRRRRAQREIANKAGAAHLAAKQAVQTHRPVDDAAKSTSVVAVASPATRGDSEALASEKAAEPEPESDLSTTTPK